MFIDKVVSMILVLNASSFAALPPLHQSVREIKAILESSEVIQKLGSGRTITNINHKRNFYIVTAEDCLLQVDIRYVSSPVIEPGPAKFNLEVGSVECH